MSFAEKLQSLRKSKGISQEQLAELLDVSRQSISKWESGQNYPEIDKLIKLSDLFDITLDDLVRDKVSDSKNEETENDDYSEEDKEDSEIGFIVGCFILGVAIGVITENAIWGSAGGLLGFGLSYLFRAVKDMMIKER
jgi:transcriptional regulator with XRE-family HTH domain